MHRRCLEDMQAVVDSGALWEWNWWGDGMLVFILYFSM